MKVGSNPSCVDRRQDQQTGRVLSMVNQVAALALDDKGCGDHEYCYGNVSIVLGATAAEGAVRCHQQTGRASWSTCGSWGKNPFGNVCSDSDVQNDRQFANYLLN